MVRETPKDTAHVVFINGFVGTSLVKKYLFESVKSKFSVDIIRSYMASGRAKNEQERVAKYNQEFSHNNSLILSKTLDIYKIYLILGIFLIYRGK